MHFLNYYYQPRSVLSRDSWNLCSNSTSTTDLLCDNLEHITLNDDRWFPAKRSREGTTSIFHAFPSHSRTSKQNAYPSRPSNSRDYTKLMQNTEEGGFTLRCLIANWDVSNGIVSTLLCRQQQVSADACSVDESDCLQWQRSCCIKKAEVHTCFVGCFVKGKKKPPA